ncbi:MAG TPA: membrane-bound lytic murein transglycosylase MltF [Nevskiaceae bacterium]
MRHRWYRVSPRRLALATTLAVCLLAISTCSPRPTTLEWIQLRGVLRVASTNSPTTCYVGPELPLGFQCEVLERFADALDVQLVVKYVPTEAAALRAVERGQADLAAGVVATRRLAGVMWLSAPLQQVTQQLVSSAAPVPKDLAALQGTLEVPARSAAEAALTAVRQRLPDLQWTVSHSLGAEDLLYRVAQGTLAYTVSDSDLVALNQRFYPGLVGSLQLTAPQAVVWATRRSEDTSLNSAIDRFFTQLGATLDKLRSAYFTNRSSLDSLDITQFTSDYDTLLPEYRQMFISAAKKNGMDWRLLAAIGYQESHWDPSAVSPTGVRGLMMLTLPTAQRVNVADREHPGHAIHGGARYFAMMLDSIPASVPQPDRTWMALAAWNMGLGHLLDARGIVQKRDGNPDRWNDVKRALPLLTQEKWFDQTRYGYAPGNQAVRFVDNVRSYYDILVWLTAGQSKLIAAS